MILQRLPGPKVYCSIDCDVLTRTTKNESGCVKIVHARRVRHPRNCTIFSRKRTHDHVMLLSILQFKEYVNTPCKIDYSSTNGCEQDGEQIRFLTSYISLPRVCITQLMLRTLRHCTIDWIATNKTQSKWVRHGIDGAKRLYDYRFGAAHYVVWIIRYKCVNIHTRVVFAFISKITLLWASK